MNEKWNINVVLCKYCDEETGNVQQIFNKIKMDKDVTPPFYMVTFINGLNVGNQLALFYCIDKIEAGSQIKRAHAGKIRLERKVDATNSSNNTIENNTVENGYIDMVSSRINGIKFPGLGAYELKVYGFTDKTEIARVDQMDNKKRDNEFTNEHLFATYPFEVVL